MRLANIAALTVSLLTASFSFAQDNTSVSEEFPTATLDENAPREVVKSEHGDWQLRCTADESNCFLYQLALNAEGNPVAEVSLVALPEGGDAVLGATVVTPLMTLLPQGLTFRVDADPAVKYPFIFCNPAGCFSRFGLTGETVDAMKSGANLQLAVFAVANRDTPQILDVSLSGFTDGVSALSTN